MIVTAVVDTASDGMTLKSGRVWQPTQDSSSTVMNLWLVPSNCAFLSCSVLCSTQDLYRQMAMMIIPLIIRSFHRQPHEPIGCVMFTDLPWMSEPSHLMQKVCD